MSSVTSVLVALLSFGLFPMSAQLAQSDPAPEVEPAEAEELLNIEPVIVSIEGAERDALLADISASIGQIETAKGRFFQIGADYSEAAGDFYLRRPGRVRFDYDDPNPLLIVADGATVAIEDSDLETQDRVPLSATPLAMLLDDDLDFETEANVLDVRQANGVIGVTMEDRSGENEGLLTVFVDENDYSIVSWRTQDAAGGVTSVSLAGVETGMRINARLFRIEDIDADDERD
ncbi:MAG: outer membrane lipoprotein carrier protein LolA [Hyphomonadaceae bacterium]